MSSTPIPTSDLSPIDSEVDEELLQEASFSRRRCCFWMPCLRSDRHSVSVRSNWWERITENDRDDGHRWWSKGLAPFKKIREWSELFAGPKWKTFIRRFNKHRSKHSKFQYDPTSYSLNFDEGPSLMEDDDRLFRDFSSRYAAFPISAKSSMDLGKDGPTLT